MASKQVENQKFNIFKFIMIILIIKSSGFGFWLIEPEFKYYVENEMVTINQIFAIDMISARKVVKNDQYFSFNRLFDEYVKLEFYLKTIIKLLFFLKVWLNLLIFTISTSVIFSLLTRINFSKYLMNLFSLLTNQSANDLTLLRVLSKVRPLLTKISLVLLTFIWLQSASVLTKAFTGLLLETYFNVRSETLINSLQDLHRRTDLSIAAHENLLDKISKLEGTTAEMLNDFKNRIQRHQNKTGLNFFASYQSPRIFNEIINGQTVLILSSVQGERYCQFYRIYLEKFGESSNKYGFTFINHIIFKNHPLRLIMKFL